MKYKIGQTVYYADIAYRITYFVVGAVCGYNGQYRYSPQVYSDHSWTSEELLYPSREEAIKDGITKLTAQQKP